MKPVRVRPQADRDINRALADLWEEYPSAAVGLIRALDKAYRTLSGQPGIGSLRYSSVVAGLRMWCVGRYPYLVFYIERADRLDVVRVLHEAREIPALLEATRIEREDE